MELTRTIFWDTEYDLIQWDKKARYVIERVMTYRTMEDWESIRTYYGLDRIRDEMLLSRDLDPKSLSFF